MINIAVCDNNKLIVTEVENLILDICREESIDFNLEVFYSGTSFCTYADKEKFDILFLDIEMPEVNGLSVARKIREVDDNIVIIFISGHEEYLLELFDVEPFRFMRKPIDAKKFREIFLLAYKRVQELDIYFEYKYDKYFHKIKFRDIIFFESIGRTIHIFTATANKDIKFYGKLNDIEERMNTMKSNFLRIHQSYLINFTYIDRINYSQVVMKNGIVLKISRDRRNDIREQYCKLLGGYAID